MERKDKLKDAVKQAEQQQAKVASEQQQMEAVGKALLQAQSFQTIASGKERLAKVQEDRASATLDQAKAFRELEGIDLENFSKTLALLQTLLTILQGQGQGGPGDAQPGGLPQIQNMNTIGQA